MTLKLAVSRSRPSIPYGANLFRFCLWCVISCYHFLVLLAFVVLGSVSSLHSQEIVWEERLRNDLICVEWDVKRKTFTKSVMLQMEQRVVCVSVCLSVGHVL